MTRRLTAIVVAAVLTGGLAGEVAAAPDGIIRGQAVVEDRMPLVCDEGQDCSRSVSPVPGLKVRIVASGDGSRSLLRRTNRRGNFRFRVPVGQYRISTEEACFGARAVRVRKGSVLRRDLKCVVW